MAAYSEHDRPLRLLRQLNPADPAKLTTHGIDAALVDIAQAISRQPYGPRRRTSRPRLKLALAVATTACLVVGGVATAAVVLHARTGIFASGSNARMGGPGEELNPAAPDIRSVALQIASDIPYPKGYESWRDFVVTEQITDTGGENDGGQFPAGLVSSGAVHGWFAASAFCAWIQDWRQATISGASAQASHASSEIAAAPGWGAITHEDPHPDPSATNDPGAETGTLFGWLLPYRDAVSAGDLARVDRLLASGYGDGKCWLSDPAWTAQERANRNWRTLSPSELAQKYEQFLAGGGS